MKLNYQATLAFFAISLINPSLASVYSTGFEAPTYNLGIDLAGQDGWALNDANTGVSYFATVNGGSWGYLGGVGAPSFVPATQTSLKLSHAHSGLLVGSVFSVDFDIEKSNAGHPNRDSFNWSFSDGSELLSIAFEPNVGDPNKLEIAWYINGSPTRNVISPVSQDIFYNGIYNLNISFAASGADALFTATLTPGIGPALVWDGTLAGDASSNLTSFAAGWDLLDTNPANAGSNYMVFDNISVFSPVPEPSVFALGMLSLGFFCKRRRNRL